MKIVAAFTVLILFSVAANLLLKTGASASVPGDSILTKALSWQVFLGLACFGSSALVYFLILGWLPLNTAQSFAAAQFVAVVLAAHFFLEEPINAITWSGISLIAIGIAIVGWAR